MKRVLVTGGAAGIGHAIVKRFIEAGDRVLTCDVDADALARAQATLPGLLSAPCDVADAAALDALFDTVRRELGGLDVLINNVGVSGPTVAAEHLPSEDWQRVIDVNLTGAFEVTRRAIPLLKDSADGTIVVMSSAAGRFGYPNRLPYAVSKWGLVGLTKTLSMELGEYGISVNAILPGAVGGDRFDRVIENRARLSGKTIEETIAEGLTAQSIKRIVEPEHVADLAWFLTTPSGRSISGQMLPIDGDQQHG
ncbi:MAG: SDR family oxidoreductase [Sphingobium sp.]|nr:SDR family oxidoreductase [Sphingobium sp.]